MTDFKRLIAWHEAEGCRFAEFMATDDRDRRRVEVHRETARILSLLLRVREGCYMDKIKDTMDIGTGERNPAIRVTGPVETLRRLAELLEKAK